ncbi:uncharacterized protein SPPG_00378 [Spizellomyces punctatus DAOM BR117]|uniref:Uncharacterized protein n=1 Tax=Spizellomyces punctatus (strain DAOM BR117) TaxID=645134 RepID=A0A0L0HU84_SPIPD|nr:uncharacterized protein SPPG_00378 [Spizellomyces punctatus DAOM BR117]KND04663.1 hypothetical protein SPPG_00378 [Spizellomyces punctatus DAOM BR117]|eukprot:XP_016612702.1 hypothetical protein SPPG_00378 [Spizellomyces punctatus DAOM BR117]
MATILSYRWSCDEDYFEHPTAFHTVPATSKPTTANTNSFTPFTTHQDEHLGLAALAHHSPPRASIVGRIASPPRTSISTRSSSVTGDSDVDGDESTTLTGGSCPSPALEEEPEINSGSIVDRWLANVTWVHFQVDEDAYGRDQCRCNSKMAHAGRFVLADEDYFDREDVMEVGGYVVPGGVRDYVEHGVQRVRLGHRFGKEDFVEAGIV